MKKILKGSVVGYISCLMLLLGITDVVSQTTSTYADFQEKYWYYRHRLRNDFMVIGRGAGMSIPAARRNGNNIHWGETTVYHGYYMGVLATERKALETPIVVGEINHYESLETNKREMYYALLAMERLDYVAETHPSTWSSPASNGFFTRDDVPSNFAVTHDISLNSSYTHVGRVTSATSDWTSSAHGGRAYEMSKDQLVYVLMGLKLIWKYTPNVIEQIRDKDGTVIDNRNLHEWSKSLAIDFIDYALDKNRLKNPVSYTNVPRGDYLPDIQWPLKQLKRGFNGYPLLKWPRRKVLGVYRDDQTVIAYNHLRDPSSTTDYLTYKGAYFTPITTISPDNTHMAAVWGCIAENSMEKSRVIDLANTRGWTPFYSLLYDVIRTAGKRDHNDALSHLYDAPCEGISHGVSGATNTSSSWHATQRYLKDVSRQRNGQSGKEGYYNGLDYMLLHNMYSLQTNNWIPVYDDQVNWFYNDHFYKDLILRRYPNDPTREDATIVAFESLKSDITLSPTANVNMRAVEEITLIDGFETMAGSELFAYLGPYQCLNQSYQRTKQSNDQIDEQFGEQQLNEFSTSDQFKLYPNPTNGNFSLELSIPQNEAFFLTVRNIRGQEVFTTSFEVDKVHRKHLNFSEFPKGIYLIQLESESNRFTEKLVIQ